jgi:signal peptidase I
VVTGCGANNGARPANASASIAATGPGEASVLVYRVPSRTMEPTLPIGTTTVVKKEAPAVGAIVVFHPPKGFAARECGPKPHVVTPGGAACNAPIPEQANVELIARVVGGPGDEIDIRGGRVYRKADGVGAFVREGGSYIRACSATAHGCSFPVPIKIPSGYWFTMGDNRGESDDSRFWGPVPTGWAVGRVTDVVTPHFATVEHRAIHEAFQTRAAASVAACLHRAGVSVPRSDSALLSSTSGIRTRDPRVKVAIARCRAAPVTASR